jgi:hypothetical protein
VDYLLRYHPEELDSTGYIEIGPGPYRGRHWQPGFVFVWEDAFTFAEGIIATHAREYDHFSMNDIPSPVACEIAMDWRRAADLLDRALLKQAGDALHLERAYHGATGETREQLETRAPEIATMLRKLAEAVERYAERAECVAVLGI